jgi:hypothetical protein
MKKILLIAGGAVLIFAVIFAACNSKPSTTANLLTPADTAGLASFQKWKALNELQDPAVYYMQGRENAPVREVVKYVPVKSKATAKRRSGSGSMSSQSQYPAKTTTTQKKGWSKAAKGTAIGTAGGAVLGAVINKRNRVVGGVVGGVLGGVIGYGVGRHIDKKDGRY